MGNTTPAACRGLKDVYIVGLSGPRLEEEEGFNVEVEGYWLRPEGDYFFEVAKGQNRHLVDVEFVPNKDAARPRQQTLAKIQDARFAARLLVCEINKVTDYLKHLQRSFGERAVAYEPDRAIFGAVPTCTVLYPADAADDVSLECSPLWPSTLDEPHTLHVRFNPGLPSHPLIDGAMRALLQTLEKKGPGAK